MATRHADNVIDSATNLWQKFVKDACFYMVMPLYTKKEKFVVEELKWSAQRHDLKVSSVSVFTFTGQMKVSTEGNSTMNSVGQEK